MPKDWQLLPPHSQELLRAARSGRLYKRPAPAEEEDIDAEAPVGDKAEKKEDPSSNGFMVKVWKQVPRNAEGPTVSHLAKRHKSTVTLAPVTAPAQSMGPTITRATVRRVDAAGNPYTQEVVLTDGQKVDGEIISTSIVPAPAAAKADPTLQAPTPVKKRPPPPKRKAKSGRGRGRGRGRGGGAASTRPIPQQPDIKGLDGAPDVAVKEPSVKVESESGTPDVDMVDRSVGDDEEGDDNEGDDDEGEGEGEDEATPDTEDRPGDDQEMAEAPPSAPQVPTIPAATNLALPSLQLQSTRVEGSPLKNVILPSPTDPIPGASLADFSRGLREPPPSLQVVPKNVEEAPAPPVLDEPADVPVTAPKETEIAPAPAAAADDDDPYPFGSLEASLNLQAEESQAQAGEEATDR